MLKRHILIISAIIALAQHLQAQTTTKTTTIIKTESGTKTTTVIKTESGKTTITQTGTETGQVNPLTAPSINPEEDAFINAYAGFGYYQWKMISDSSLMKMFTGKSYGAAFSHDAEPFVLKRYGVKTNIAILKLGLDYFSDKLSVPLNKDSGANLEKEKSQDEKARQIKLLGGVKLGSFFIDTNVVFREFNSTITSKGNTDISGNIIPLTYYNKEGNPVTLQYGDKISWYTKYKEYDVRIGSRSPFFTPYAGLKYITFEAPTSMNISYFSSNPSSFDHGDGDILTYTKNRIITAFMGFAMDIPMGGGMFVHYDMPASLAVPGGFKVKSNLYTANDPGVLSFSSLSTSVIGDLSLQFRSPFLSIKVGGEFAYYYSSYHASQATLKRNIVLYNNSSHTNVTAPAGEKIDLQITRSELFWGLYLSASLFF